KADIDSYSGVITEALDGSKKAISEKKKKREALTKSLRLLGRYVEIMCKNDMPTFLSSAFSFGFVVFLLPFMSKFIEFLESLADFLHAFRYAIRHGRRDCRLVVAVDKALLLQIP